LKNFLLANRLTNQRATRIAARQRAMLSSVLKKEILKSPGVRTSGASAMSKAG
jgi:hypothetical protein